MMKACERLIKYAKIHTASAGDGEKTPSTERQFDLANILADEMKSIGMTDVSVDENCYVYGKIKADKEYENVTPIGFLSHVDTVPDFPGDNVKPRVIENYGGGDIKLGESDRILSPADFPHLKDMTGKTLIVTDGTTVLGADDKAGIAEIMTAAERIISEKIPHGQISVCFCPDEEIGHGASLLDFETFGAKLGYTVDGGALCDIEYENFNAAGAEVTFRGFNVHPGSAKNVMINASLLAMEFNSMLPSADVPSKTEGYEGFFHLTDMKGDVQSASLSYIIRDHDKNTFEARKKCMEHIAKTMNEKYGDGAVTLVIREQYRNMIEMVKPHIEVVEKAFSAAKKCGLTPTASPIRGGTDGAQLSFRGLPCPNLPTGSYGHHGPYEHAVCEEMDVCVDLIVNIVREYASDVQ